MTKASALPDQDVLRQLLDYDPDTGRLSWRARPLEWFPGDRSSWRQAKWNSRYAGTPALQIEAANGYLVGNVEGKRVYSHRVIWKLTTGEDPEVVDHINGDRHDNRLSNLRSVSNQANGRNASRSKRNTSGVTGVHRYQRDGTWQAEIRVDGKTIFLGRYEQMEAAIAARQAAEAKHGFHPNHGRAA